MKYSVFLSPQAEQDLRETRDYLRDEGTGADALWISRLSEVIATLQEHPHRGAPYRLTKAFSVEVRQIFFGSYKIFYGVCHDHVVITRIYHMSRRPLAASELALLTDAAIRFQQTITLIDEANSADPNTDTLDGVEGPKEQIYGIRMMAWVERLNPEASDELKIAARAQHICRWEVPRSDYPEGKAGYYQWRTYLYGYHAAKAGELMREAGYSDESIERVRVIMDKKNLRKDADTQTLEDAAALVFLENHLGEFSARDDMDEEKMIDILHKTWGKMSEAGHDAALKLVLPEGSAALVGKALNG